MAIRADALAIMAKAPVAGQVKTRMLPALSAQGAAELARALLLDQLEHLQKLSLADLYLAFAPAEAAPLMKQLAPGAFRLISQEGEGLGEKMDCLFETLRAFGHKNIVLIGGDLPPLPFRLFEQAYVYLQAPDRRAVLGPSRDGGYYLIGLNQPLPEIFEGMTWSHDRVLAETKAKLACRSIDPLILSEWFDIDTLDNLRHLRSQLALLRRLELSERQNRPD